MWRVSTLRSAAALSAAPRGVRYFFESGTIGIVDRTTGQVTIKQQRT
jgi:hypothetical protein